MSPSKNRGLILSCALACCALVACAGGKDDNPAHNEPTKPTATSTAAPPARTETAKKPEPAKTAAPPATTTAAAPATTTAAATAATGVPAATTPAAAATTSKYRKLTPDEITERVKQIGAGHTVFPEHSFALNAKNFTGSVLSTTGPTGKVFVFHFFDAAGKRITSVFDKDKNDWEASKILAVVCEDVDHDNNDDFVVVGNYTKPAGGGVSVYNRPGAGPFIFSSALSKKGGTANTMTAALAALKK